MGAEAPQPVHRRADQGGMLLQAEVRARHELDRVRAVLEADELPLPRREHVAGEAFVEGAVERIGRLADPRLHPVRARRRGRRVREETGAGLGVRLPTRAERRTRLPEHVVESGGRAVADCVRQPVQAAGEGGSGGGGVSVLRLDVPVDLGAPGGDAAEQREQQRVRRRRNAGELVDVDVELGEREAERKDARVRERLSGCRQAVVPLGVERDDTAAPGGDEPEQLPCARPVVDDDRSHGAARDPERGCEHRVQADGVPATDGPNRRREPRLGRHRVGKQRLLGNRVRGLRDRPHGDRLRHGEHDHVGIPELVEDLRAGLRDVALHDPHPAVPVRGGRRRDVDDDHLGAGVREERREHPAD